MTKKYFKGTEAKEFLVQMLCEGFEKTGMILVGAEYRRRLLKRTIEKIISNARYAYYKRKKLKWAKEHDRYDFWKMYYDDYDDLIKTCDKALDSVLLTERGLLENNVKFAKFKLYMRLRHSKKHNDRFRIDENGNKMLIAGEVYHDLFYHTYADGVPVNHHPKTVTCLKAENGEYLLERPDGRQHRIKYADLGIKLTLNDTL